MGIPIKLNTKDIHKPITAITWADAYMELRAGILLSNTGLGMSLLST
jgi:hypothetical protein